MITIVIISYNNDVIIICSCCPLRPRFRYEKQRFTTENFPDDNIMIFSVTPFNVTIALFMYVCGVTVIYASTWLPISF